jgi:hypothetical protein
MNQRAEIVLDGLVNDRMYRLSLPGQSSFTDAYTFLDQLKEELQKMESIAMEQEKKRQELQQESAT